MRSSRMLAVVVAAGCSGGGGTAPGDAVVDALVCTHVQNLRTLAGKAEAFGTQAGRFGGTICIGGRADLACASADAAGDFEMCVPASGDFGIALAAAGFENTLYLHGPGTGPTTFAAGDDAYVGANVWTPIGGTYPPVTVGHLVVVAIDGAGMPLAGAEVALLPSAGLTVSYAGTDRRPEPGRVVTSAVGIAYAPDVPPQMIDIQVNSLSNPTCAFASGGYASPDTSQHARVPIAAGVTVVATLRCTP